MILLGTQPFLRQEQNKWWAFGVGVGVRERERERKTCKGAERYLTSILRLFALYKQQEGGEERSKSTVEEDVRTTTIHYSPVLANHILQHPTVNQPFFPPNSIRYFDCYFDC
jgi:hypothetical protein